MKILDELIDNFKHIEIDQNNFRDMEALFEKTTKLASLLEKFNKSFSAFKNKYKQDDEISYENIDSIKRYIIDVMKENINYNVHEDLLVAVYADVIQEFNAKNTEIKLAIDELVAEGKISIISKNNNMFLKLT